MLVSWLTGGTDPLSPVCAWILKAVGVGSCISSQSTCWMFSRQSWLLRNELSWMRLTGVVANEDRVGYGVRSLRFWGTDDTEATWQAVSELLRRGVCAEPSSSALHYLWHQRTAQHRELQVYLFNRTSYLFCWNEEIELCFCTTFWLSFTTVFLQYEVRKGYDRSSDVTPVFRSGMRFLEICLLVLPGWRFL